MINRYQSYIPGAGMMVFIAMALIFLPWLGETLFYSKGEPREAIVGMSILQSGNWILPVNYGTDIPYKPPFLGWLIAALAWLLNGGTVNEYISRLPSVLAMMAMVGGGYLWARRERGTRFAMIFSFVTFCSFEVFRAALACRLDMVLTACMVGSIYLMYHIREHKPRGKAWRYIAVVALLTAATLTKGPVGALLPCFVIGVYRLLRGDRFFPTLFKMLGLSALALILPAWWFYSAWQQGGDHFYDLMWEENFGRLFGTMSYESHVRPFWYNFVTLAAGLLPWTVLLLAAAITARRRSLPALKPAGLLALTAAVLIVGFYCIPSSKRSTYLLPAYPLICYAITCLIESKDAGKALRFFAWFTAALAVIAPVALTAIQIVRPDFLRVDTVPWWGYILLAVPLTAGIAWFVNRHSAAAHVCASIWALYFAYVAVGMPMVLNPLSDKNFAAEGLDLETCTDEIYTIEPYRLYSSNFYSGNRVRALPSIEAAADRPSGTVLLIAPHFTDTTGLGRHYDSRPLTARSADHRDPLIISIHR